MPDAPDELDVQVGRARAVRAVFDSMPVALAGLTGPQHRVDAVNHAFREVFGGFAVVGLPLSVPALLDICDQVFVSGVPQTLDGWPAGDREIDLTVAPRRDAAGSVAGVELIGVPRRESAAAGDEVAAVQRELLPTGLPLLPSVRLDGGYLPAGDADAAGGDWLDAVALGEGRVALIVGDVVGHGVAAAAAMGQLRAVLHDRLGATGDLLDAVGAADRLARRVPEAYAATVCIVQLDPADGRLTYCSAGHPPPLLAGPRAARFLPASGHGPLGTGATYLARTARLEPDEIVLLYSDGLIERPGGTPAAGNDALCRAVAGALSGPGPRDVLTALDLLIQRTGHTDDITVLVAARRDPPPSLRLTAPPGSVSVRGLRAGVEDWADALATGDQDRVAFAHVVTELVTNALEHGAGTVTLTAGVSPDGEARITVADQGRWRERPRPGDDDFRRDHGFGLAMVASFADRLDIDTGAVGTTVTVHRRLSRPLRPLTAGQSGSVRPGADPELMMIVDQPNAPSSRVAIHGPLDAGNVDDLSAELDRLTLGGSHDLVVDLSAVTLLASAAVSQLYRSDPRATGRRCPLRLYAPAGSTADQVLTLVDLPHATVDPHALAR
ncbi:RsbU-like Serine phosphatase [Actinoplanes sp. SE50]|uniref:SpoIIE family protein phosphatase n=1 Tax=unclassified Actinoplanes TaxID=2626549 RepID=UPI00023EBE49|nr:MULTISPECIES: SpoIIE family protein phosphatase [unclassified Actinoplanes]AEV81257.1 RsbU-like Serine phosphatase [Actinoplanes sp. SE50/110]ATO79660.1 RsbU-like Serine phosphatase [Actinoplanes sp. SE50]SLL97063.1 regulator of sigma subunit [Actinoplanes sp. SE50/110]